MRTSNRQANSLLSNAMFRVTVERQKVDLTPSGFIIQNRNVGVALDKSPISEASKGLYLGANTVLKIR